VLSKAPVPRLSIPAPLPRPWQPLTLTCLYSFTVSRMLYSWNRTAFSCCVSFLCVFPQLGNSFLWALIFNFWIYHSCSFYPLTHWRPSWLLNKPATSICARAWKCSVHSGKYQGAWLLKHLRVFGVRIYWTTSTAAAPPCSATSNEWELLLRHSLSCIWWCRHPGFGCWDRSNRIVMSPCCFSLHFFHDLMGASVHLLWWGVS
jgi:hypothetical protein